MKGVGKRKVKSRSSFKKNWILPLIIIFLIVFSTRMFFALQDDSFSYDDSHFVVRQLESIRKTGTPIFKDELSFGGRVNQFMPVFHYISFPFYMIYPENVTLKILSNLFASSLVIIVFLLAKKISKNNLLALSAAALSGFIPAFFDFTVNDINANALAIPLLFLAVYSFFNIDKEGYIYLYLFLMALISSITSLAIILVIALLVYLIFVRVEGLKQSRKEIEIILFSTFLIVWRNFIFFKKALLTHGHLSFFGNVPSGIISSQFSSINPLWIILQIGLIPLLIGVYASYKILFKEKERQLYLFVSFIMTSTILLWLRLVSPLVGLTIISISMILMFPYIMSSAAQGLKKTRAYGTRYIFFGILILLFVATSIIPSLASADFSTSRGLTEEQESALKWISMNVEEGATILSSVNEGHAITLIAKKKNVWDSNFLMIENPNSIFEDVQRMYRTGFETEAVKLLNKYNVNYIMITNQVRAQYGIENIVYANDINCFKKIYDEEIKIYQSLCKLE